MEAEIIGDSPESGSELGVEFDLQPVDTDIDIQNEQEASRVSKYILGLYFLVVGGLFFFHIIDNLEQKFDLSVGKNCQYDNSNYVDYVTKIIEKHAVSAIQSTCEIIRSIGYSVFGDN